MNFQFEPKKFPALEIVQPQNLFANELRNMNLLTKASGYQQGESPKNQKYSCISCPEELFQENKTEHNTLRKKVTV